MKKKTNNEVLYLGQGNYFLKGAQLAVTVSGMPFAQPVTRTDIPDVKPEVSPMSNGPWAVWGLEPSQINQASGINTEGSSAYYMPGSNGSYNLWPEYARCDIRRSIMLSRALESRKEMFYGNGIFTYTVDFDESGNQKITPLIDPQFEAFKNESKLNYWLARAISDHEDYANTFPMLIFSRDKSKVNKIVARKARQCRWELIDGNSGKIENCYESAFWPFPGEKLFNKYPVINLWDDRDEIRADSKTGVYIFRAMYPLSDNDYYAVPAWYSARESGWLEIERACAAFKQMRFRNEISLKYHIELPYDYFEKKWSMEFNQEWKSWSVQQRQERMNEYFQQVNDHLTGTENAMKTMFSFFGYDPQSMKEVSGMKITPLDGNPKGDDYLNDIDQANTQISYAAGWDRSLIGQSGKSLGSGSGSDKREAGSIFISMLRLDIDFLCEPLYFARDYNGWNPKMQFGIIYPVLTTLDKNPTGTENTLNGNSIEDNPTGKKQIT